MISILNNKLNEALYIFNTGSFILLLRADYSYCSVIPWISILQLLVYRLVVFFTRWQWFGCRFSSLQLLFSDPTHSARATCVDWSPDSSLFATGSLDQNIVVWKPTASHSERSLVIKGNSRKFDSIFK